MSSKRRAPFAGVLLAAALAASEGHARADALSTAVSAASNGLVSEQTGGKWTGYGADNCNGTIISGLVTAFGYTGNASCKTAAQTGASTLITTANNSPTAPGIYLGDELYALTRVAGLQAAPGSNIYESAANNFFGTAVNARGGNSGYINSLITSAGTDKTVPTINLAYYTLAAYAVDARNNNATSYGAVYRAALISTLGKVADTASNGTYQSYPTTALGAAVWALAQTGNGLDSTLLTGPTSGQNVFGGHRLSDLPGMLDGRYDAGTHTFDYLLTDNTYKGYTEDSAFGILGLSAADSAQRVTTHAAHITAAKLALIGAVDTSTGDTYDNALSPAYATDLFAGQTLQALQTSATSTSSVAAPEPASAGVVMLGALVLMRRPKKSHGRDGGKIM